MYPCSKYLKKYSGCLCLALEWVTIGLFWLAGKVARVFVGLVRLFLQQITKCNNVKLKQMQITFCTRVKTTPLENRVVRAAFWIPENKCQSCHYRSYWLMPVTALRYFVSLLVSSGAEEFDSTSRAHFKTRRQRSDSLRILPFTSLEKSGRCS